MKRASNITLFTLICLYLSAVGISVAGWIFISIFFSRIESLESKAAQKLRLDVFNESK